jgi:acyl dehydratase
MAEIPQVGDAAPPREFGPITRTDIVRYAGASGDFNPIHHDEGYAQSAGFPTVFSIGMLQAGLLSTFATDWLGAERLRRITVRFREQVWPDDVLSCSGLVTAVNPTDGGYLVEVDLTCVRQTGGVAIGGSAAFLVED